MKYLGVYLTVLLSCLATGLAYKAMSCEGGHLSIACPPDTYIDITTAMYGRQDNNITCPHATAMAHTNCTSNTSLTVAQILCNGEKRCEVDAISYHFGDPCSGTYKYLQVEYTCKACVNAYGNDAMCEKWALEGGCEGVGEHDPLWMKANCAKTCYKCSSYVEPVCENIVSDVNCTLYAKNGDCTNNTSWMGAFCKKSCGHCEQSAPCMNKVNDSMCDGWYLDSQCTNNTVWMLPNCAKSCFACNSADLKCENKDARCDIWAMQGYCESNPGYMVALCTKSCLTCTSTPACVDFHESCDQWAKQGECVANAVWMYKNCWKSCTQCQSAPECKNVEDNALCEFWAARGECTINYQYMITNCRLSCTRCKELQGPTPKCLNALLNDTACDAWAQDGECATKPEYMLSQCYKSCTNCYTPYRIGNAAAPGEVLPATNYYSIIMPNSFSESSVVTQFTAYFASLEPVHLQLWRATGSNTFDLVYDYLVYPKEAHQTQTVIMTQCVVAQSGDYLGFSSVNGPSPIGYTIPQRNAQYLPMGLRGVTGSGAFSIIEVPFVFSLTADYYPGTSC